MARKPATKVGRVPERDGDDVGGEPEVGVEHGAHHLHRVAAEGEVVRDDLGDEADGGGHDEADAVAVDPFENDPEHHRAPADEDGRGIEVGHRRPAFEDHAEDDADGVDDEAQHQQVEAGAVQQRAASRTRRRSRAGTPAT